MTARVYCLATALAAALLAGEMPEAAAAPIDLTKDKPAKTTNGYNLGPTGALGWLHVEGGMTVKARQVLVTAVEAGSPADGLLEVGDVILGTFGKGFSQDARKAFGLAIGRAETEEAKGILPLTVRRRGTTRNIRLKLEVMGAYSDTSPYNCPKAEKVLERVNVLGLSVGRARRAQRYFSTILTTFSMVGWGSGPLRGRSRLGPRVSQTMTYRTPLSAGVPTS